MSRLEERDDDFSYGYQMRCDCGATSPLSAADYYARNAQGSIMDCVHCQAGFNFGPAVAAIRDPRDEALDNNHVNRIAWYHTSTTAEWPSTTYADDHRRALEEVAKRFLRTSRDRLVERHLTMALHVGTYEAAIENMLRRMHDQGDAQSVFFLHRIALRIDPTMINDGYRDENTEDAARITTADLRSDNLEAVRYLNVHEAVGSLSLAVLPEVVTDVQSLRLPVPGLGRVDDAALSSRLAASQMRLDDLRASAPSTSGIGEQTLRMMQLGLRPDPGGVGAATAAYEAEVYALWNGVEEDLVEYHLDGVSPVIALDFRDALAGWRSQGRPTVQDYARHFAVTAALLTHRSEVRATIGTRPPRVIPA